MQQSNESVLVTGATGFIALRCIAKLLQDGYRVRGTLRNPKRAPQLTERLESALGPSIDVRDRLSFVAADLESEAGWPEATQGCDYVLHVASPVPTAAPKNPDDVIVPARDGTLRVLKAAAAARVRRVVLTSSTAAVLYGHDRDGTRVYNEDDWSQLTDVVGPYERSKTVAERAAWAYVESLPPGSSLELVTINPGAVLGPLLATNWSVSGEIVRKLLSRELPGCPDLGWAPVDVRDVADAHVAAMTTPQAKGQRFIVAIEHTSMLDIARVLAKHFGPRGFKVPLRRLPDWTLKLVALWDKTAALTIPELGKRQDVDNARARAVLGWQPRTLETMVVDMAESMLRLNVVSAPGSKSRAA